MTEVEPQQLGAELAVQRRAVAQGALRPRPHAAPLQDSFHLGTRVPG